MRGGENAQEVESSFLVVWQTGGKVAGSMYRTQRQNQGALPSLNQSTNQLWRMEDGVGGLGEVGAGVGFGPDSPPRYTCKWL